MHPKSKSRSLLLIAFMGGILMSAEAHADVRAVVRLRGATITDTTVGDTGEVTAQHDDTGSLSFPTHTLTTGGDLTSDATAGRLDGAVSTEIEIPGIGTALTGFVQMFIDQQDTYSVEAGTSGLPNGAPVQVRIQAVLEGRIVVEGRSSGTSGINFSVTGVPGVSGPWINWVMGGLNPPQDIPIEESWSIVVDTTVGATFQLESNLDATFNGTAFDGPTMGRSWANGTALIRVSPILSDPPGATVTTEAGAPTEPLLPAIPLASPAVLVMLVGAIVGIGALLAARQGVGA